MRRRRWKYVPRGRVAGSLPASSWLPVVPHLGHNSVLVAGAASFAVPIVASGTVAAVPRVASDHMAARVVSCKHKTHGTLSLLVEPFVRVLCQTKRSYIRKDF